MENVIRSGKHFDNHGKFCEDEKHVFFHCEAHANCRMRLPVLFIHYSVILNTIVCCFYLMINKLISPGFYGILRLPAHRMAWLSHGDDSSLQQSS